MGAPHVRTGVETFCLVQQNDPDFVRIEIKRHPELVVGKTHQFLATDAG